MEQKELKIYEKKLTAIANILDKYDEGFVENLNPDSVYNIVSKKEKTKANT